MMIRVISFSSEKRTCHDTQQFSVGNELGVMRASCFFTERSGFCFSRHVRIDDCTQPRAAQGYRDLFA